MHRFFLTTDEKITTNQVILNNPELVHQLSRVLRFKVNQQCLLLNSLTEQEILVTLIEFSKKSITAEIIEIKTINREPKTKINLHFAILKNADKVELILQKCTELGVAEFTPLITARSEKKQLPKIERLTKIITEACEQSGRISIPKLNDIKKFNQCLSPTQLNLVADPYSQNQLNQYKDYPETINLFIGPEGGFTPEEIDQTVQNQFKSFKMGDLILRAETACIVATSKILI